ncbi:uncharacterized protein UV8b_07930 [Ustilaginoidea virens]|uniref:Uncharacterized protein n=1 Tax=Ustilaginoidea virens TaxID=1159556 RepID=A0A8E5HXX9_USTVR|nr:uncharacterized protein UV8b_07930 [Ustilaginoidea virens]QUC23689.1 hypothetical protein UV8b_07930 [Ustilaginoidea virens]
MSPVATSALTGRQLLGRLATGDPRPPPGRYRTGPCFAGYPYCVLRTLTSTSLPTWVTSVAARSSFSQAVNLLLRSRRNFNDTTSTTLYQMGSVW